MIYAPGAPEPLKGRAALRQRIKGFLDAFPDMTFEYRRAFGQGDWACWEDTGTGTHTGPLTSPDGRTIPPTNKRVTFDEVGVFKSEGEKVTEMHPYFDLLGSMAQLGLVPG